MPNLTDYSAYFLTVNTVSTLLMTGLIWFVQVVHYPLMKTVGMVEYTAYQGAHMTRTSWVVIPVMVTEVATGMGLLLVLTQPGHIHLAWRGLGLLALVWLSTACLQAPAHRALLNRFDSRIHSRLVQTNWLRTIGWTARSWLMVWLCIAYFNMPR